MRRWSPGGGGGLRRHRVVAEESVGAFDAAFGRYFARHFTSFTQFDHLQNLRIKHKLLGIGLTGYLLKLLIGNLRLRQDQLRPLLRRFLILQHGLWNIVLFALLQFLFVFPSFALFLFAT